MSCGRDRFVVITGGPGAGKSTLVDALGAAGLATSEEAGRQIIRQQRAIGGNALPWADRALFAELMLAADMRAHERAATRTGTVVFDRGIPDVIGYLRLCGFAAPPQMAAAARLFRHHRRVFIAPPWPEIFAQDEERRQTPEEAARTHAAMAAVYAEYGYELVELPRVSVAQRVRFILRETGAAA